jgi:RNA polymerase sigma-70 factor (ECF subfamily)
LPSRRPIRGETGAIGRTGQGGDPSDRSAADDTVDFEALYHRYRRPLYALCLARLGDRELAEDVMQEVFATALAILPTFDRRRPFWPWLASIAARDCIDAHRRRALATVRHAELGVIATEAAPDSTSHTVLGRLAHETVVREIDRLPPRQRTALQLFAVDGWSYAEIAERLGCSIGTVKLLIVRARARLRQVHGRVLGGLGGAWRELAGRVQVLVDRAAGLAPWSWPWSTGGLWPRGVEASAALALVVMGSFLGLSAPATGHSSSRPGDADAPTALRPRGEAITPPTTATRARIPAEPEVQAHSRAVQRAVADSSAAVLEGTVSPASGEEIESFAVSPGYEEDGTVFAVDTARRVSVTHDGGASWSRLQARGLNGARLLLPPGYPSDRRIFSLGGAGLQMSDNGGDTFEVVAPGTWLDAAVSPAFDDGDPTVLLAGAGLWRYDSRTGRTEPVPLDEEMAGHLLVGVHYNRAGADGPSARLLSRVAAAVVTGSVGKRVQSHVFYVSTCRLPTASEGDALPTQPRQSTCATTQLRGGLGELTALSVSPVASKTVFVRGHSSLLVSTDEGRTFRAAAPWGEHWLAHLDMAALPGSASSLVVARRGPEPDGPALLRTDDAGASWTPLHVDVPGFTGASRTRVGGARSVAVTPSGRILAGGEQGGIACSADGGRTWAPLCPTPDA